MATSPRPRWAGALFWSLVALVLVSLLAFGRWVDLRPRVESDFFFGTDDPALQATRQIDALFPRVSPVVIAHRTTDPLSEPSLAVLAELTRELDDHPSVASVRSLVAGPEEPEAADQSPLWRRLLLGGDGSTSYLFVELTPEAPVPKTIDDLDRIVASHESAEVEIDVSGVPYVVEKIRRALERDLRVFSLAALVVFGLVVVLLYRSLALVAGTLLSCLAAAFLTLTALAWIGIPIGLLTANLATIVFVLTLSHTVFLTANWQRIRSTSAADQDDVTAAVRTTFPASFACMSAALLGFGSLFHASARPLRELGLSGGLGTIVAIIVAYGFYPRFLELARSRPRAEPGTDRPTVSPPHPAWVGFFLLLGLVAAGGLRHLDTDPSLLEYFDPRGEMRVGLDAIDAGIGSSPLYLVVSDPSGTTLDAPHVGTSLTALQETLDEDRSVGTALSLAVLVEEAHTHPLARLLSWRRILQMLATDRYDRIAERFLSPDRTQTLIALSMREGERSEPRQTVIARIVERVDHVGLRTDLVGGLYDLQGRLGRLVGSSLRRELGGLLLCFVLVAWWVSRSIRTALAMGLCLATLPVILLGILGHLGIAVDVISSPAVNVAIALGIDAMIHLAAAARRLGARGTDLRTTWLAAVGQQRSAILGAMAILATGFAVFLLSSFPPTQRFGALVAVGMMLSALLALRVLPTLASWGSAPGSR